MIPGVTVRNKDTGEIEDYRGWRFIRDLLVYGPLLLWLAAFRRYFKDWHPFKKPPLLLIMFSAGPYATKLAIFMWITICMYILGIELFMEIREWIINHS